MKIVSFYIGFILTFSFGAASFLRSRKLPLGIKQTSSIFTDVDEPFPLLSISSSSDSNSSKSISHLTTTVDYSPQAVINRLRIYIRGQDPSAIFCELKGNLAAVTLEVFNGIISDLFEILQYPLSHDMFLNSSWHPVGLISAIFSIFIKFRLNIARIEAFNNNNDIFQIVINKLRAHHRSLLAFFILLGDCNVIDEICRSKSINFYAVAEAILMVPDTRVKTETVKILYKRFSSNTLQSHKIPQRLFRDSPDVELCKYVVSLGFDPQTHPHLFNRCRLHRDHPKWDYFAEIYGYRAVHVFLDSDWHLKPGNSIEPKIILPFVLYPLRDANHPRWSLYSLAYGEELVQTYKLTH